MGINLKLKLLSDIFCISRLSVDEPVPRWALDDKWYSITKTENELSIVCREQFVPQNITCEGGWKCFKIDGVLDFKLTGILSSVSTVMSQNGISIFAISTYNTDYVLVKNTQIDQAIEIFTNNNFQVIQDQI